MPPGLHPAVAPVGPQFSYVRFLSPQNSLSAKLGMVTPEISRRTLFLKAHIYKSMTLNRTVWADCDEDHRRPLGALFWPTQNLDARRSDWCSCLWSPPDIRRSKTLGPHGDR